MGDYHEPQYVCGNPETLATGQLKKLRTNRPKVWFEGGLPGWDLARWKAHYLLWANKWSLVCNVEVTEAATRQEAHWIVVAARMDGRNGVLADAQLPGPPQQLNRYDVADVFDELQLGQTCMHEVGHLFGLVHLPEQPPADVMEPRLNKSLMEPQTTEAKLMLGMYGEPRTQPTPPTPATGGIVCTMTFNDQGATATCAIEATKPGHKIAFSADRPKAWERVQQLTRPIEQPESWDVPDTDLE